MKSGRFHADFSAMSENAANSGHSTEELLLFLDTPGRFPSWIAPLDGLAAKRTVVAEEEAVFPYLSMHPCSAVLTTDDSVLRLGTRMPEFFRELVETYPGLTVLVVCHQNVDPALKKAVLHADRGKVILVSTQEDPTVPVEYLRWVLGLQEAMGERPAVQIVPRIEQFLQEDRLQPHFQPIVDLSTGSIRAYEALARSRSHSVLGNPGLLFAYAARKNLHRRLDAMVAQLAIEEARQLSSQAMLFLNIQPRSLTDVDFAERLHAAVMAGGRQPSQVCVELTEQEDSRNHQRFLGSVRTLRERGFQLAVDDFGEGNANLELVHEVRPEVVKISGQICRHVESSGLARSMIQAVTSIARDSGVRTIAEFIESESARQLLQDLGVDDGQGWHLGRPMPAQIWAEERPAA